MHDSTAQKERYVKQKRNLKEEKERIAKIGLNNYLERTKIEEETARTETLKHKSILLQK